MSIKIKTNFTMSNFIIHMLYMIYNNDHLTKIFRMIHEVERNRFYFIILYHFSRSIRYLDKFICIYFNSVV